MTETITSFVAALTLIGLAEIGDKSQIVCMALASRYSHWPVLLGAAAAPTPLIRVEGQVNGAGQTLARPGLGARQLAQLEGLGGLAVAHDLPALHAFLLPGSRRWPRPPVRGPGRIPEVR